MKLIKTALLSGVITIIRILTGFISNKVVALYAGPSGVAIIGAFSNFISIVLALANGSINTGIIKYTSEFENDEEKLKSLFSTSFKISLYCSVFVGILLIFFASFFSKFIFDSDLYPNPIRFFGITIILYSLNSMFISILNGKSHLKEYTIVNALGSIIAFFVTLTLVFYFKLLGAIYAMILSQVVIFFVTIYYILKSNWFSVELFKKKFDNKVLRMLSHYSLMAIFSATTIPLSQIIIRNMITSYEGIGSAGIWQGMMKISDGYLTIFTLSLSTYYLPKLSSLKTNLEIKNEIFYGYKIILPVLLITCFFVYLSRYYIIGILFSVKFKEMESLFFFQLLGDFFKIAAWILGYLMIAKSMTKMYLINEFVFNSLLILFSFLGYNYFGLIGITIAFALNNLICLLFMIFYFRELLSTKEKTI